MSAHGGALEAVERVLNRGGEADDVLRQVVAILHERLGRFVRISFVEGMASSRARPRATRRRRRRSRSRSRADAWPTSRQAASLTEEDRALLERVAILISPYALVGWDTNGEGWNP